MMKQKLLWVTLGWLALLPFYQSAQAMDGAELYHERTCIACHGKEGREPVMAEYPKIAGQSEIYLVAQMKDIKSGARGNSHSLAMKNMMHLISDDEMVTVARWLSTLPR